MIGTSNAPLGIIENEPESIYRNSGCLGNTMVSDFIKSESLFYRKYILRTLTQPATDDMILGIKLHKYMESFRDYRHAWTIKPGDIDGRTKEGKAWNAAHPAGTWTSRDDHVRISRMAQAIRRHPDAKRLLADAKRELVVRQHVKCWGLDVQVRFDAISVGSYCDYKKCKDVTGWPRHLADYGYHRQAALYGYIHNLATFDDPLPFTFICVEDNEPYRVQLYQLSEDWLERGWSEVNDAMIAIRNRLDTGGWRMSKTGIKTLIPKPWERMAS